MYFKYGGYTHEAGEISLSIAKDTEYSELGDVTGIVETWNIRGQVHGDDAGDVTTKIEAIESAYANNDQSFGLYEDDGTATAHVVNRSATDYVRITQPPSFPTGDGAEYTTYRNYTIQIEVRYGYTPSTQIPLVSFSENITVVGGGPRIVWIETLNGPPQMQIPVEQTTYTAVQSGRAVGRFAYPSPPSPLWQMSQPPQIDYQSPEKKNGVYTNYGVRWQYQFQSGTPLIGYPHIG